MAHGNVFCTGRCSAAGGYCRAGATGARAVFTVGAGQFAATLAPGGVGRCGLMAESRFLPAAWTVLEHGHCIKRASNEKACHHLIFKHEAQLPESLK